MTDRKRKSRRLVLLLFVMIILTACSKKDKDEELDQKVYDEIWQDNSYNKKDVTLDNLSLSLISEQTVEEIKAFSMDDKYYFFLPSYADTKHIRFSISPELYQITYQGMDCNPQKEMKNLAFDQEDTLVLTDIRNGESESSEVIFLKSENLNTMYITTSSGKLDTINEDKENKESGNMILYDEQGQIEYDGGLDYLSGRGNQTWDLPKRPYQIKLEKKANLLGMGEAKKWILLANILDDSFIRNKIVYDMAIAVGLPYSPESDFVDLYLNGEYVGNYQISEKIEIGKERVDIYDLESETEELNKNIDFKKMQSHESEDQNQKWIDMENNPDDITGGYLIERDYWEKYGPERSGFKTTKRDHFVIKSPENASRAEVEYIRDVVQQLEDAIYADDGVNPQTGIYYTDYLDLESWAKKYMIEEFTKNEGAGTTSSWFYKPSNQQSTKIFAGPVWDYDKSLGRYEPSCYRNPFGLSYLTYHHYATDWFRQLYTHDDFKQAVKKYYVEDFKPYLNELLEHKVDDYAARVKASAYMDHIRWSEASAYWMFNDFEESVSYVKDFIRGREEFLDLVWENDEIYCMIKFKVDGAIYEAKYVKPGEMLTDIPDLHDKYDNIIGWCVDGTEDEFDFSQPINQDYTLYLKCKDD